MRPPNLRMVGHKPEVSGFVASSNRIEKKKNGEEKPVSFRSSQEAVPMGEDAGPAIVGMSQGLTLPGPKNSYMVARVDVWCSLPSKTDDESIKKTQDRITLLLDKRLEHEAGVIRKFFEST